MKDLSVFPKDTTALYAENVHRTRNLTITIQRLSRLSNNTAKKFVENVVEKSKNLPKFLGFFSAV